MLKSSEGKLLYIAFLTNEGIARWFHKTKYDRFLKILVMFRASSPSRVQINTLSTLESELSIQNILFLKIYLILFCETTDEDD